MARCSTTGYKSHSQEWLCYMLAMTFSAKWQTGVSLIQNFGGDSEHLLGYCKG
jgi:hypothetical protein